MLPIERDANERKLPKKRYGNCRIDILLPHRKLRRIFGRRHGIFSPCPVDRDDELQQQQTVTISISMRMTKRIDAGTWKDSSNDCCYNGPKFHLVDMKKELIENLVLVLDRPLK